MPQDYSRKQILDIIEAEAKQRGIPRDDFLRFAYIETGGTFNERASRGPAGAKGLFQFVPATAAAYGISGRELDPVANTDAAARLYLDNRRALASGRERDGRAYLSGKREPDGLDMYLAHQQGIGGYRSIQAALATGEFSRRDTRANIINNVSPRDLEQVAGIRHRDLAAMPDRDLARVFVTYWDRKFDRVSIPEMGIAPIGSDRQVQPGLRATTAGTITLNRAFELSVEHDDVRYRLGAKSIASGTIDCSGWIVSLQNATMREVNTEAGREVFSRADMFSAGMDGAAMIVQKAAQRSGRLLEGAQVGTGSLREGMVIGEDNGRKPWDAGRFKGIDHIVMVVRDPESGRMMISQSRGGEGVEMVPLDRYLRDKHAQGVRLFAADPLHDARSLLDARNVAAPVGTANRTPPTRPKPTAADADGYLQEGEAGPAVAELQRRLADLGYRGKDGKPLVVDADFGGHTKHALGQFQRDHGLQGLGVAGPNTGLALDRAERALMSHPSHPQHALYTQVLEKVHAEERARGLASGHHSQRIAAALAVECLREGITRVDRVEVNADNSLVRAVQVGAMRDEPGLNRATDGISVPQAARQALAESTEQIHQVAVNLQAQQRDQQQRSQASVLAR